MKTILEFPIKMIPKDADRSLYNEQEKAQDLLLLRAHAINRTSIGDLPMTPGFKASIEQAERVLSKWGYLT